MVNQAAHLESLQDLLVPIFREAVMRGNGNQIAQTVFEAATDE